MLILVITFYGVPFGLLLSALDMKSCKDFKLDLFVQISDLQNLNVKGSDAYDIKLSNFILCVMGDCIIYG